MYFKYLYFTAPEDGEVTPGQIGLWRDAMNKTKEKLQRLTTEHRDLHGTVSKVGKSIDRNMTADFTATSRIDLFETEKNIKLLDNIIAQHFHRQGMDDIAETLIKVSFLGQLIQFRSKLKYFTINNRNRD